MIKRVLAILCDRVLLFVLLPELSYDVHVYVGNAVISSGGAEGAGPGAVALHEGLVSAALADFGPAGAHYFRIIAFVVLYGAQVAGVAAVDVHKVGVPDTLSLPGPAGAVRRGVPAGLGALQKL